MIRLLATCLFFATLLMIESDCLAQRHRFFAKRGERVQQQARRQEVPNLQEQLDAANRPQRKGFFAGIAAGSILE